MVITSVDNLVEALRGVQLLTPEQLAKVAPPPSAEPKALAKDLVRRGWLTVYQAQQVLSGRASSLVLGPYVLLEVLGQGGMGQVFKARQRNLDRLCALKIIRKERLASADAIRRFLREAKAAARLSHPNIIAVFDADQVDGTHYLAMEYIHGADLAKRIADHGPLPVAEACRYIQQAALGLQHAHECGLVHRDIKPHNILVSADGSQVKILDLGLALHTENDRMNTAQTQKGALMGTPDYMAPEQCLDARKADIRSDLYSLGCTLYHLLAGQAPFAGGSPVQVIACHLQADPPALEEFRDDVPEKLEALVRKLMAKPPEDRYQTPVAAAKALEPFCRGPAAGTLAGRPKSTATETQDVRRRPLTPDSVVEQLLIGDKTQTQADEESDDTVSEDKDARRRKAKRKKKESPLHWLGKTSLFAAGAGAFGLLLLLLAYLRPGMIVLCYVYFFVLGFAGFWIGLAGAVWYFKFVYDEEGAGRMLLCIFLFPFYDLYYFAANYPRGRKPFQLHLIGLSVFLVALFLFLFLTLYLIPDSLVTPRR